MEAAVGVRKAGWKPVVVFLPAFFLVFLVPSVYGVLGLDRVVAVSGGLITYTLFNTWFGLLLTVGVVAIWYGGLELKDLGVNPSKIPVAVGITIGCWLLYLLAQLAGGLVFGNLTLHSTWTDPGVTATIGKAIGFFFGNAPFEELAFRGFLLVQLYLLLDGKWWQANPLGRTITAIAGSSLIFTLFHIPAFLWGGIGLQTLGSIFVYAVALSLVYLRTQNIFLAMGFHALANFSVPLLSIVETGPFTGYWEFAWLIPGLIIVLLWPRLPMRSDETSTSPRSSTRPV